VGARHCPLVNNPTEFLTGEVRMIEKVEATRGTERSTATRVGESMSITSEPDNTWFAKRQSTINENLHKRSVLADTDDDRSPGGENDASQNSADGENSNDDKLFSGESPRIGTGNWDDDVPDGEHVGYL
jgi:hypothetical protein